ncbi:MAG TPA: GDP-mannose 4,6-dehydratase [bacterium]|nr:GDP-mannose 4,6-dehydratase [bacterium]
MSPKALITGITGQDGYFLSQLLINKGYQVYGLARRKSNCDLGSLSFLPPPVFSQIKIIWGDITDNVLIDKIIKDEQFTEVYHLAAQSYVAHSFVSPRTTYDINIGGTLNLVNALKDYSPQTKLYFAATSEMFGRVQETPQTEHTPFYPRSPYAISKLAGFWTVKNYREAYHLFFVNGISFNHESEMRGPEFVTQKIVRAAVALSRGSLEPLAIGNLDAERDWGYAGDYVLGMWQMLQQTEPDDYILATGISHSVRHFTEQVFSRLGFNLIWSGQGLSEVGRDVASDRTLVVVDPVNFRPAEVERIRGDASKAKTKLGWAPHVEFEELIKIMINYELQRK